MIAVAAGEIVVAVFVFRISVSKPDTFRKDVPRRLLHLSAREIRTSQGDTREGISGTKWNPHQIEEIR